jgi:trans-2-enoyl-CoA reductase
MLYEQQKLYFLYLLSMQGKLIFKVVFKNRFKKIYVWVYEDQFLKFVNYQTFKEQFLKIVGFFRDQFLKTEWQLM